MQFKITKAVLIATSYIYWGCLYNHLIYIKKALLILSKMWRQVLTEELSQVYIHKQILRLGTWPLRDGNLLSGPVSINILFTKSSANVPSFLKLPLPSFPLRVRKYFIRGNGRLDFKSTPYLVFQFSSAQFSHSVMSDSLRPHESQHARPPCPSPTPGVHSHSRPSSQWCHPAISSSFVPFSSCIQSLPASESFPMSQLFAWSGQSTGVSALASFLPKKS